MKALKFMVLVITFSLYAFGESNSNVSLTLDTSDLDLDRTTASVNRRGSGYEARFSKDKIATFVFSSTKSGFFEVRANYSSKNYDTDVELDNGDENVILQSSSTSGHGNFTSAKFNGLIKLSEGSNTIVLTSNRPNFYLRKLVLQEVDFVIEHNIPKNIKSWEFSESSQSITKSPRGSSYEMRFKKGLSLSYALKNHDNEAPYDLVLEYSSKKRIPKLEIYLDDNQLSVNSLPETSGHGSFKKVLTVENFHIPSDSSVLKIKSNDHNFYLRALRLSESTSMPEPVVHKLPRVISATKYADSNMNVNVAKRGSGYEVRMSQNQLISYLIENETNNDIKFDLKLNYSSARTFPKLNVKIGDMLYENISLDKTDSHGNYITRDVLNGFTVSPGIHRLEIFSHNRNLYFKNIKFIETVEETKLKVYQLNVGGPDIGSWVKDLGANNEIVNFFDESNRRFYMIGSDDSMISNININSLSIDNSVPSDTNLDIFQTFRKDKTSADFHVPGINYEFALSPGEYDVFIHLVKGPEALSLNIKSNATISNEQIILPQTVGNTAMSVKLNISHTELRDFVLGIMPVDFDSEFNLAGIEILSSDESINMTIDDKPKRYVSPHGAGNKSGSSPGNARAFKDINGLISNLSASGGEILLLPNKGIYRISKSYNITKGGVDEAKPVVIKTYRTSESSTKAIFKGVRQAPWIDRSQTKGKEFLRLMSGANNLVFEDIHFEDFGNGIFRIAKPIKNLKISKVRAVNFTRLIENNKSGSGSHASVENLVLENTEAFGYTRAVIRLQYSSENVVIDKILGDSQGQLDAEDFPMGITVDGNVSNVLINMCLMKNHRQVLSNNGTYFNGDGIATESNVDNVLIQDTISSGNTDGGFDLKSTNTKLLRTLATHNKRNYRFWNPAIVTEAKSINPMKYGGSGNKVHFGAYGSRNFLVDIIDVDILDTTSNARVFSVGETSNSRMNIERGKIVIEGSADLRDSSSRVNISSDTEIHN